jgi:hypothetical protein
MECCPSTKGQWFNFLPEELIMRFISQYASDRIAMFFLRLHQEGLGPGRQFHHFSQ